MGRYPGLWSAAMFSAGGGGWLWLVTDVGFVVLLVAALVYGTLQWRSRRRDRAIQRERDAATERLYKDPHNERS